MILAARDIEKRFEHRVILNRATLALHPGEVVLLVGANGSGKTTLARIMSTMLRADRGSLTLDGTPVEKRLIQSRRAIGFASHRPFLYLGLTPIENLEFFGRLSGLKDARARASRQLERFGMTPFANTPVDCFSRGMLQRVALLRALQGEPSVLLLDEPYAGLDDDGTATLNAFLIEARDRGAATLVISHDRDRVATLHPRICAIRAGKVEERP